MIRSLLIRFGIGVLLVPVGCVTHGQNAPMFPSVPDPRPVVSVHDLQIPDKARSTYNKGAQRLAAHEDARSIPAFQKAIKDFPNYFEAYVGIGAAEARLQRWDDAEAAFRKAIELSKGGYAPADFGLGMILSTVRQQFGEAENVLRAGLQLAPADVNGNFLLGWVLYSTNRLRDAEQAGRDLLTLEPNFAGGFLLLAQIHIGEKQYAAILDDLNGYEALGASNPPDAAFQANLIELRSEVERALAAANAHSSAEPLAAVAH